MNPILPTGTVRDLWAVDHARAIQPSLFCAYYAAMVRRKNFGRGIHTLMLVEERANILGKLPVARLSGHDNAVILSNRASDHGSFDPRQIR